MATSTLWLHVGAGKTGSSAIQSALVINRRALSGLGVDYPAYKTDEDALQGRVTSGNGGPIAAFLCGGMSDERKRKRAWRFLDAAFEKQGIASAIVFSSELMAPARPQRLEELAQFAAAAGRDVRIVYYVRHLLNHAVSLYNDLAKSGNLIGLGEHLLRYRANFMAIASYEKVFGVAKIDVRVYDEERHDIFGGFVSLLGVSADGLERPEVINRGLSPGEVAALQQASRAFAIGGDRARQVLFRRAARLATADAASAKPSIVVEPRELAQVQANNGDVLEYFNTTHFGGAERLKATASNIAIAARPAAVAADRRLLEKLESELGLRS